MIIAMNDRFSDACFLVYAASNTPDFGTPFEDVQAFDELFADKDMPVNPQASIMMICLQSLTSEKTGAVEGVQTYGICRPL